MNNPFTCPACQQRFVFAPKFAGQTLRCPRCRGPVRLPEPELRAEIELDDLNGSEEPETLKHAAPRAKDSLTASGSEHLLSHDAFRLLRRRYLRVAWLIAAGGTGLMALLQFGAGLWRASRHIHELVILYVLMFLLFAGFASLHVWMLTRRWRGYSVILNREGITGKICGDVPVQIPHSDIRDVRYDARGCLVVMSKQHSERVAIPEGIDGHPQIAEALRGWGHGIPRPRLWRHALAAAGKYTGYGAGFIALLIAFYASRVAWLNVTLGIAILAVMGVSVWKGVKRNPLGPVGTLATLAALLYFLYRIFGPKILGGAPR